MNFVPLFSVSFVVDLVSEDCLAKSEKLNFGVFPNVNIEETLVVDELGVENWNPVTGVVAVPKLVKANSLVLVFTGVKFPKIDVVELAKMDGLLLSEWDGVVLSSFVVTICICLAK